MRKQVIFNVSTYPGDRVRIRILCQTHCGKDFGYYTHTKDDTNFVYMNIDGIDHFLGSSTADAPGVIVGESGRQTFFLRNKPIEYKPTKERWWDDVNEHAFFITNAQLKAFRILVDHYNEYEFVEKETKETHERPYETSYNHRIFTDKDPAVNPVKRDAAATLEDIEGLQEHLETRMDDLTTDIYQKLCGLNEKIDEMIKKHTPNTPDVDPLPCPWCGQNPNVIQTGFARDKWIVLCSNSTCFMSAKTYEMDTKEKAINIWNDRK